MKKWLFLVCLQVLSLSVIGQVLSDSLPKDFLSQNIIMIGEVHFYQEATFPVMERIIEQKIKENEFDEIIIHLEVSPASAFLINNYIKGISDAFLSTVFTLNIGLLADYLKKSNHVVKILPFDYSQKGRICSYFLRTIDSLYFDEKFEELEHLAKAKSNRKRGWIAHQILENDSLVSLIHSKMNDDYDKMLLLQSLSVIEEYYYITSRNGTKTWVISTRNKLGAYYISKGIESYRESLHIILTGQGHMLPFYHVKPISKYLEMYDVLKLVILYPDYIHSDIIKEGEIDYDEYNVRGLLENEYIDVFSIYDQYIYKEDD